MAEVNLLHIRLEMEEEGFVPVALETEAELRGKEDEEKGIK